MEYPKVEMLLGLLNAHESCRARCEEILRSPISLKVIHMVK